VCVCVIFFLPFLLVLFSPFQEIALPKNQFLNANELFLALIFDQNKELRKRNERKKRNKNK
jgi:hypothetical protein